MAITYAQETGLTAEEYIACVGQTTLGASRPLGNVERVQAMIDESDLVVTARAEDGTLLGLSRTITDWHWVAYCMDLANSGPGHWQLRWSERMASAAIFEQADWHEPELDDWVDTIDQACRLTTRPVVLVAHSLSCTAVAHAAPRLPDNVRGAFLVAPTDIE